MNDLLNLANEICEPGTYVPEFKEMDIIPLNAFLSELGLTKANIINNTCVKTLNTKGVNNHNNLIVCLEYTIIPKLENHIQILSMKLCVYNM